MFGLKVRWNNKDYQYHQWEPKAKSIDIKKDDIDFSIINEFISNFKSTIKKYFNDWEIEEIPDNFNDDMVKLIFNSFEKREQRSRIDKLIVSRSIKNIYEESVRIFKYSNSKFHTTFSRNYLRSIYWLLSKSILVREGYNT